MGYISGLRKVIKTKRPWMITEIASGTVIGWGGFLSKILYEILRIIAWEKNQPKSIKKKRSFFVLGFI